ncbi:MAG: DUF2092 domain-containing protein [Bryobacteraceae bacterium]|nr:DUF2092 domain-containing protein [Bryobacteraceae bacterium]
MNRRRYLQLSAAGPLGFAAAPVEPRSILARTAERYALAAAFDVVVEERVSDDLVRTRPIETIRLAACEPHRFLYQSPAPPTKVRFHLGCDGETITHYLYLCNEYKQEPLHREGREQRLTVPGKGFLQHRARLVAYFPDLISRAQRPPAYVGLENIDTFGRKRTTHVIHTRCPEGDRSDWSERLWIDPGTSLVLRSLIRRWEWSQASPRVLWYRRHTFDWRHLGDNLEDAVFRFQPPKGARLVETFCPARSGAG